VRKPETRGRASGVAGFSPLAFLAAVFCFLLPFVEVSCQGIRKSLTGAELALGGTFEGQQLPAEPLIAFAAVVAFLGVVAGLAVRTENATASQVGAVLGAVLGFAGGLALLAFAPLFKHKVQAESGGQLVEIRLLAGFWLTLLLLMGSAIALGTSVRFSKRTGQVLAAALLALTGACSIWGWQRIGRPAESAAPRAVRPKVAPKRATAPAAAPVLPTLTPKPDPYTAASALSGAPPGVGFDPAGANPRQDAGGGGSTAEARRDLEQLVPAGFVLEETLEVDLDGDGTGEWLAFYGNGPAGATGAEVASRCVVRPESGTAVLVKDEANTAEPADFGFNREPPSVTSGEGYPQVEVAFYRRARRSVARIFWAGTCCGGYVARRVEQAQ
jgi:hypothetical protein